MKDAMIKIYKVNKHAKKKDEASLTSDTIFKSMHGENTHKKRMTHECYSVDFRFSIQSSYMYKCYI